uniref:NADH-ubiquinone oxidoreductase chain 6 n=1 Tax=Blackfordia virginica TaxID=47071 RepID=A0A7U0KKP6_9CNID|nr:NADH dehydrogenase subunit 6 [Blackfordia virginica]QQW46710.1 NADH dehydrogenase subunit 6 [Blackfordia virginica]
MEQLYIYLSIIILIGSIMVISSLNPIHSVFWLVLVFLNSAALLLLLGFDFIPLMLVVVYVGAIAILFLFVIMMLDVLHLKRVESITNIIPIIIIAFTNIITYLYWYFNDFNIKNEFNCLDVWNFDINNQINIIGKLLYTYYCYPFIIMSLLLLVAMIGAIVLVLDLGLITRRQKLINQHQRYINKH